MYRRTKMLMSPALLFALALTALAGVPRTISYQGRLTDNVGTPVADGNYNVNLAIWNDPVASALPNKVWESGSVGVTTEDGLFSVNLGAAPQSALPESLFVLDTVRWLGISVNGGLELTPRTKLTSVAYAYVASTVPDSSLGSHKITNEAGITSSAYSGSVIIPVGAANTMADVVTTSITTPSSGYVLVLASGQLGWYEVAGSSTTVSAQIDQVSGGGSDGNIYGYVGVNISASSRLNFTQVMYSRFYVLFSPGTYTFRLEAFDNTPAGADNYFWNPRIHAMYFPTYYELLFASAALGGGSIDTAYTDEQIAAGIGPRQLDPATAGQAPVQVEQIPTMDVNGK